MPTSQLDRLRALPPDQRDVVLAAMPPDAVRALAVEASSRTATAGTPADYAAARDPSYRRPEHIDVIAQAIRNTILEADAGTGPGRLIINTPPRVGKSTTTSLWTPAWFLERWPDRNVILATHTHNYSVSWGRKVRDLIRRGRDAGRTEVELNPATTAAGEWETSLGGGMLSTGVGGAITGRGAGLLIIDDPIKGFIEAHSQAVRQNHWDWYLGDASTRLEPGAAVIVLMTRWHEDDLVGRLLSTEHEGDPSDWTVVRIPALGEGPTSDAGQPDALARDVDEPLIQPQHDGQTVDEARERWRAERRARGPYIWNGLYQQRPSEPEGTILKRGWWQFYWRDEGEIILPDGTRIPIDSMPIVQSWDMAYKDLDSSDWVVGQVWGTHQADRFLLDQFRARADIVATLKAVKALRRIWSRTAVTWIEDAANGPAVMSMLKREVSGLSPRQPRGDKKSRAWAVQGTVESGNVWLPSPDTADWTRALVDECAAFPNGAHDDQVDALTQALINLAEWGGTSVTPPTGSQSQVAGGRTAHTRRSIQR